MLNAQRYPAATKETNTNDLIYEIIDKAIVYLYKLLRYITVIREIPK